MPHPFAAFAKGWEADCHLSSRCSTSKDCHSPLAPASDCHPRSYRLRIVIPRGRPSAGDPLFLCSVILSEERSDESKDLLFVPAGTACLSPAPRRRVGAPKPCESRSRFTGEGTADEPAGWEVDCHLSSHGTLRDCHPHLAPARIVIPRSHQLGIVIPRSPWRPGDLLLFLPVILSITTPGLSRHTFPWTPGAPLRLPRKGLSFVRSIPAAL